MTPMPPAARARYDNSLAEARALAADGRFGDAWARLETSHILSQPWWNLHVQTHWRMLLLAMRTRDRREIDVPATRPMPVPDDLAAFLER